jgi:CRP-like cAMP-binding protein
MPEAYQNAISVLLETLNQFHPISKTATDFLRKHCRFQHFSRGHHLLQPGEICKTYYFIYEGMIRCYFKDGDREITTWVSSAGEMVTSIHGMNTKAPSIDFIQTLSRCSLLLLDAADVDVLYKIDPTYNLTARKLLEHYYSDAEIRSLIARMPSAEMKYKLLSQKFPHLVNSVPQKYIASYLGIREETLSRLINSNEN